VTSPPGHTLYFDSVPPDYEGLKTRAPRGVTITGSAVYVAGVFDAILQHCSYDELLVPPVFKYVRSSPLVKAHRHRLTALSDYALSELRQRNHLVFMTPTMNLSRMTRLRRLSGHPRASAVGIIHSLSGAEKPADVVSLLVDDLGERDAVICSSAAGRTALLNYCAAIAGVLGRAERRPRFGTPVIPLGVDLSLYGQSTNPPPVPAELGPGPIVLYLGRFSRVSKADLYPLIVACRDLSAWRQTAQLVLAGDDTQFNMALELVEFAAAVAPSLRLVVVPNPDQETKLGLLSRTSVFVSPSDSAQETFGLTILEAMASGVPCIAADWNGYRDIIEDGVTGILIRTTSPPKTARLWRYRGHGMMVPDLEAAATVVDLEQLRRAIEALILTPERSQEMGAAGRRRVRERFDWPVIIAQYEELWAALAATKSVTNVAPTLQGVAEQDMFAHYATGVLSMDSTVRQTSLGRDWRHSYEWMASESDLLSAVFSAARLAEIAETVRAMEPIAVSRLLESLGGRTDEAVVLDLAHICRLLKYGLIATDAG
jgi:glycosyltransferase involved in cell wall biosynthesis